MSVLLKSGTEVKTPQAVTSRSILLIRNSAWWSHDE
jgi:hypothetical protein